MTDASDWCSELLRWSYSSIPPHLRSSQTRHERMQQISTMQHYATLACILHFRSLGLQPQDWSCEALWGQELRLPWAFERLEKAKVNSWLRTRALSVTCTSKTPAKHDTFNLVKVDWVWDSFEQQRAWPQQFARVLLPILLRSTSSETKHVQTHKQRHAQNGVYAALSCMAKAEKSTQMAKHTKKLWQTTFLQSVFGQKQHCINAAKLGSSEPVPIFPRLASWKWSCLSWAKTNS